MDRQYADSVSRGDLDALLHELRAERTIRDIASRYCDAADRRDWERWLSIFHSGATYDYVGVYNGRASELARDRFTLIDHATEVLPRSAHLRSSTTTGISRDPALSWYSA